MTSPLSRGTKRRVVLLPGQATEPMEIDRRSDESQPSAGGLLKPFIAKCRMVIGDLEASSISVDEILAPGKISASAAKAEIADLEKLADEYSVAHMSILRICEENGLDDKEHLDRRLRFLGRFKGLRNRLLEASSIESSAEVDQATMTLKLPKIDISVFEGKFDDWPSWYRLYESLIHKNPKLDAMQKYHFLRSRLRGTPLTLVDSLPFEGSCYEAAYAMVVAHYNDPLKRISRHLDALQLCPTMANKGQTLRGLITTYRANVTALQITFEQSKDIDPLSQLFIHSFLGKADKSTRHDWEREMARRKKHVSFSEFIEYIESRCHASERAAGVGPSSSSTSASTGTFNTKQAKVCAAQSNRKCFYCGNSEHTMYRCPEFVKLSVERRKAFVKDKRLCVRCFNNRCGGKCKVSCRECHKGHNTLLHVAEPLGTSSRLPDQNLSSSESVNELILSYPRVEKVSEYKSISACALEAPYRIVAELTYDLEPLLATARVQITDLEGNNRTSCRALLDSGSQLNLITSRLASKTRLKFGSNLVTINTVGSIDSQSTRCVQLQIFSNLTKFKSAIECQVIDKIVDLVPNANLDVSSWKISKNILLADPNFAISSEIDILLGVRIFWDILGTASISLAPDLPCLRKTKLGWIIADNRRLDRFIQSASCNTLMSKPQDPLSRMLERFWLLEESKKKGLTFEEAECERIFLETTARDASGRFIVRLPFKVPPSQLGQSRSLALKRFYFLEKRLSKNHNLSAQYSSCLNEYASLGHMKKIVEGPNESSYYIPHHAIIKETSTSTKLRVVFDASMVTSSGLSLNKCLMVGPVVQSTLLDIILRFRMHRFVFTADIVKMYRQIRLHREDTRYQRIFWRSGPNEQLKTYELTTVAFGTASAPFLATRCLKMLAEDNRDKFPDIFSALLSDFYVDDVLSGADTLDRAKLMQQQLKEILSSAGFELRKWCANSERLLTDISPEEQETSFPLSIDQKLVIKTLGLLWFPREDVFRVWVQIDNSLLRSTKRQVLSALASIFDPLGLISPITIVAKLIMQSIWKVQQPLLARASPSRAKESWDETIPLEIQTRWKEFATDLPLLNDLSIPRHLSQNVHPSRLELHGFADASERAYGAAIYVRTLGEGQVASTLLCSRSRVAPLKHRSLPQLELCAAEVLAEIFDQAICSLTNSNFDIYRLWSDSEIVLHWIHSPSNRWEQFVANRVQKIQDLTSRAIWDHVPSQQNPADLISRGTQATKLKDLDLWWHGPSWLLSNISFGSEAKFDRKKRPHDIEYQHSKSRLSCVSTYRSSIFQRSSNFMKLVRLVAWITRFTWNAHESATRLTGLLQIFEIREATFVLVKLAQRETLSKELKNLETRAVVERSSVLSSLSPFLDARNIIRVGGRLQHSNLTYDQQHPVVLPTSHPLTKLIVKHYHRVHFHAGPLLLKSVIRRQFWILRIGNAINFCLNRCHECIRMKAESRSQAMAALPRTRVTPQKPFSSTGVDYAGPFPILGKGGRHKVIVKAYVAIFVCFATKAVHLELVSELSSEAFIATLSRFVSRRGIPLTIASDNGTNFVGGNATLKREFRAFMEGNVDIVSKFMSVKGCEWYFNPPRAPHFGGLWEAGVKSVKRHLTTILSKATLTFEQFTTVLAQIEACLNSRPLIPESNDPNDLRALTPGHFLIGCPITVIPSPDLTNVPANRLKYWSSIKALSQTFWKRWSTEYLNTLQQRSKWRVQKEELKIGDFVLIKEDNTPAATWPRGRIVEIHPGSDNLTRVVTLKTAAGSLTRAISKLIYLPSDPEEDRPT